MDPSDSSTTSELGSLSDSDWLDIASSKASEDNDSVDGSLDFRPLSRRSYNSHLSSTEGSSIIAWEGCVADSGDEEGPEHPFPSQRSSLPLRVASASPSPVDDLAEDQRVRDALDQSMMSTLSGSRSSSFGRSSVFTTRDLRLSFPDPISSSRDALNRSYEHMESRDPVPPPSSEDESLAQGVTTISAPPEDSGSSVAAEVLCNVDAPSVVLSSSIHDLRIVLYGFSTDIKWDFVDQLLDRLSLGAGLRLCRSARCSVKHELELCSKQDDLSRLVGIIDKTQLSDSYTNSDQPFKGPSLGILFLPSSISSLPAHTRYLPLIPPSAYMLDTPNGQETVRKTARDRWEKLGIPRWKLLFDNPESSPIMEKEALLQLDPGCIASAFKPLLAGILPVPEEQRLITFKFIDQVPYPSRISQILFALTCGLVGCIIGLTVQLARGPHVPITSLSTTSISSSTWLPESSINDSVSEIGGPASTEMASVIPASLKDFALTVFVPASSMPQSEFQSPQPSASGLSMQPGCSSYDLDIVPSKELLPLPFSREKALSIISPKGKGKRRETIEDVLYDYSLQVARSVADLIDMDYVRAIAESLGREVKEILAVLEELIREIKLHGMSAWEHPLDTVEAIRKHFRDRQISARRNAKRRAKELGVLGERFVVYAVEAWKERKELAREGAVTINKRMFKSEKWLAYEKRLDEARHGQATSMQS